MVASQGARWIQAPQMVSHNGFPQTKCSSICDVPKENPPFPIQTSTYISLLDGICSKLMMQTLVREPTWV